MGINRPPQFVAALAVAPVLLSVVFFSTSRLAGRAAQAFYTNGADHKYMWTSSVWSPDHKIQARIEVAQLIGTPQGANSCLYLDFRPVYPIAKRKDCNPRPRDIYDAVHVFLTPPEWSPDGRKVAIVARIFDWEYMDPYGKYFDGTVSNDRHFLVIASADQPAAGYPLKPSLNDAPSLTWQGNTRLALDGRVFDLAAQPPVAVP